MKSDPAAVYQMIKSKHLLFTETPDEKEIRVNREFNALMKGKMMGHQFEPAFDAVIANLEEVGLGKSRRELYLAYVEKIGPKLAQVVRRDRRLWKEESHLRGPEIWEEAHHVVLEFEQTEHLDKVASNSTMMTSVGEKELAKAQKELAAATKKLAVQETKIAAFSGKGGGQGGGGGGKPKAGSGNGSGGGGTPKVKVCFHARDYGSCKDEKNCQWNHDPELLKQARKEKKAAEGTAGGDQTAAFQGKGGGNKKGGGKGKAKAKAGAKAGAQPPKKELTKEQKAERKKTPCPFQAKPGGCKKGTSCDFLHAFVGAVVTDATNATAAGLDAPVGIGVANPFCVITDGNEGCLAGLSLLLTRSSSNRIPLGLDLRRLRAWPRRLA